MVTKSEQQQIRAAQGEAGLSRRSLLQGAGGLAGGFAGLSLGVLHAEILPDGRRLLRIGARADIQILDPAFQIGGVEDTIMGATLVTLTRFTEDGENWEPYAADSIEQVDDRTIVFRLRDDLTWSDGFGPVTAADVKYSYERIAFSRLSPYQSSWEMLDHVEVIDDRHGVIHLKAPFPAIWMTAMPWYAGHIVCAVAVEAVGGRYAATMPAQCGPYRFVSWTPKVSMVLERNPDWRGDPVDFDIIELLVLKDTKAAELAYEAGSIDFARISIDSISLYRDRPLAGTRLVERRPLYFYWMGMNVDHPRYGDIRVRQAIQRAVDVDMIMAGAFGGAAVPSTGMVPLWQIGGRDKRLQDGRDLVEAKRLLHEAGLGDGFRTTLTCVNESLHVYIAQVIQANLGELGIDVDIKPYDAAVFWNLGLEAAGEDWRTLELFLHRFVGGTVATESLGWFRPNQVGVWNWERWHSDEFEELYILARSETDPATRHDLYVRMQDLMELSGAYVFLTHGADAALHNDAHTAVFRPSGEPDLARYRLAGGG